MLKSKLFLSVLSAILLSLAWPAHGFPYLIFLALVPLFMVEDSLAQLPKKRLRQVFLYAYISMFLWNLLTTWWIYNSTEIGAVMAIILNSLFMSLVWVVFSLSKRFFHNSRNAVFLFPLFWVAFEYLHLDWDLSWSWLNLGNVFANHPYAIQWYEYLGTLGGSWWIITVNIFIVRIIKRYWQSDDSPGKIIPSIISAALVMLVPLIYSGVVYLQYQDQGKKVDVVVVQPNMNPWSEQFTSPPQEVIERMIRLSAPLIDSNTQFWIAPESAIQEGIQEPFMTVGSHRGKGVSIPALQGFMVPFPNLQMIVGASTYKYLTEPTETCNTTAQGKYFDDYNTAILLNSEKVDDVYHKSMLVPGPEKMPFKKLLEPIQVLVFNFGGAVGSLGFDKERKVFYSKDGTIGAAPLICYESIYGGFVAEFVRKGAQILTVITNDGWWGYTPGHRQHLSYARLRAVECRRSVARSANTGISGFINQRGDLIQPTQYWTQAAQKATIYANDQITLYVRHGDFMGRISVFLAIIVLLVSVVVFFKREKPVDAKN